MSPADERLAPQRGGRCSSCQYLFECGQFCPLCKQVWVAWQLDMVSCHGCHKWIHTACDAAAAARAAPSPSSSSSRGGVGSYHCPSCRKESGGDAAQGRGTLPEVEEALFDELGRLAPPTAYDLFADDMLRVYLDEGFINGDRRQNDLTPVVAAAWRQLSTTERGDYESKAAQLAREAQGRWANSRLEALTQRYRELSRAAGVAPKRTEELAEVARARAREKALNSRGGVATASGSGRVAVNGVQQPQQGTKRPQPPPQPPAYAAAGPRKRAATEPSYAGSGRSGGKAQAAAAYDDDDDNDDEYGFGGGSVLGPGQIPDEIADLEIPVTANGTEGIFLMSSQRIICDCRDCRLRALTDRIFTPTQFEHHCGARNMKKWRKTIRILPGGAPDVPRGVTDGVSVASK